MRTASRLLIVVLLAVAAAAAVTSREVRHYGKRVAGPRAVGGAAVTAGIGQWRNHPSEWGQGAGGYVKRFGSAFGQHIVKGTIQLGVAAANHENLRYQPSHLEGFWPRTKYAVKSTFIVPRSNRPGKKTVALGRISGNLGAGMISRAWQPASAAGVGAGLASGGIGLGADVGANMAREFWPRTQKRVATRVRRRPAD